MNFHFYILPGVFFVDKQYPNECAFRFFFIICENASGLGSTRSPVHFNFFSKYNVFDKFSPSKAPRKIKKLENLSLSVKKYD